MVRTTNTAPCMPYSDQTIQHQNVIMQSHHLFKDPSQEKFACNIYMVLKDTENSLVLS